MVNKNYLKGRNKEYRVKKKYEKDGWVVIRSAGSHGFADLICINKEDGIIRFVQCKPSDFPIGLKDRLESANRWLNDIWTGQFVVE